MTKIHLILLSFIIFFGCKPSDLKIASPTSNSANGKVNFDHNLFMAASCVQCHENKRPLSVTPHGNGADCITCHTPALNAAGVRTWRNVTNFNHNPMPSSCIQCHESKRPIGAPHAFGQWGEKDDCASCHSYPTWNQAKFDHNKPLTTCIECHQIARDARPSGMYGTLHPSSYYDSLRAYFKDLSIGTGSSPIPLLPSQSSLLARLDNVSLIKQNDTAQLDCILCHSNSNNNKKWTDSSIKFRYTNHTPPPASCLACHEIQRPSTHITAPIVSGMDKGDCKSCHSYSPGAPKESDWRALVAAFNHEAQKPISCKGCHADSIPPSQKPHATNINPSHPVASGTYYKIDCIKCHTYDQVKTPRAWKKLVLDYRTHLNATGSGPGTCIQCHKIDNNSLPNSLLNDSHTKGARLNNDCVTCHTFDPINKWQRFVSPLNHTFLDSLTDRCDSCHKASVPGLSSISKLSNQNKIHVPVAQSFDCNSCHLATDLWKNVKYNHNIKDNCSSCHSIANPNKMTLPAVTQLPSGHFPIGTNQCSSCHTNPAFSSWAGAPFDHKNIGAQKCSSCHNNASYSATAKQLPSSPSAHLTIPGNADCNTCHTSTTSFTGISLPTLNVTYGHLNGDINCSSCHQGKPGYSKGTNFISNHMATNNAQCSSCHQDVSATGALFVSYKSFTIHSASATTDPTAVPPAIDTRCNVCHTGATAPGKTPGAFPGHVAIGSSQCVTCHAASVQSTPKYTTFANAGFSHTSTATKNNTSCNGCHAGATPVGPTTKSFAGHISTSAECVTCHSASTTTSRNFNNFSGGIYTHATSDTCTSCHKNSAISSVTQVSSSPVHTANPNLACNTCHNNTASFTSWQVHTASATASDKTCNTCHTGLTGTYGKTTSAFPNHVAIGTNQCVTCHSASLTTTPKYLSFAGAGFNHSASNTNNFLSCNTCHAGANATGKTASTFAGHVSSNAECYTCHSASMTAARSFDNFSGGKYTHAATDTCTSCHKNTVSSSVTQVSNTAVHNGNPSMACNTCHNNTASFTSWQIHTSAATASDKTCNTCHTGLAGTYGKTTAAFPNHLNTGAAQCVACHSASLTTTPKYLSFAGGGFSHSATNTNNFLSCNTCHSGAGATGKTTSAFAGHIPTTAECYTCHSASMTTTRNFNNFTGGKYTHAATDTCTNCHKNTASSSVTQVTNTAVHSSNANMACSTCHNNTASFTTWQIHTATATATNKTCNNCHTGLAGTYGKTTAAYPLHIAIGTTQCVTCHAASLTTTPKFLNFTGGIYHHATTSALRPSTGTVYHSKENVCSTCHTVDVPNSASNVKYSSPINAKTCAGCHMKAFIGEHQKSATFGTSATTGTKVGTNYRNGDCLGCHGDHGYERRSKFIPKLPILPGGV